MIILTTNVYVLERSGNMDYKCDNCDNIGLRQFCYEHKKHHGHGMVHLEKQHKNGSFAYWLCNACAEKER